MFCLKPGKDGNIFDCRKPKCPKKQIILKLCPRDNAFNIPCRPDSSARGMLIKTSYQDECGEDQCGFIIETFDGECLVPINLDELCINATGDDGELVAILYEDVSDHYCSSLGRPVRIVKIPRLWHGEVRTAVGLVRRRVDSAGVYHQILDTRGEVQVTLIPVHTMGVSDDLAFMTSLEGKTISITYVDYAKETDARCGIPVTIIDYSVVV